MVKRKTVEQMLKERLCPELAALTIRRIKENAGKHILTWQPHREANVIEAFFIWSETPEGHSFWFEVEQIYLRNYYEQRRQTKGKGF